MNFDIWEGLTEAGDEKRHEVSGIGLGGSQTKYTPLQFLHLLDDALNLLFIIKNLCRIVIKGLSLVCQKDSSTLFLEKLQVAGILQEFYLGRDGRLGDKKLFGRLGDGCPIVARGGKEY